MEIWCDMECTRSCHSQDIMLRMDNDRKAAAKYCDITLMVDDHPFPVHKTVLGVLSTFFDKMFHIDMKEKRENKVEINGVSKEMLEVILDFIYTDEMALSMENVFAVIEAAHLMDLPYVKETCSEYLGNQVDVGNWSSIRAYAKRYDYKELLDEIDELLCEMFDTLLKSEELVELDAEELKHLLGLENREVKSEEEVYKAVIGWIKHDVGNREKYVVELLGAVNFSKIQLGFLKEVVFSEELIANSVVSSRMVMNSIINYPNPLPVMTFLAVNDTSVLKYKKGNLEKRRLWHNHRGGSAVKCCDGVYVMGGCDSKRIERVDVNNMKLENGGISRKLTYAAASVVVDDQLYLTGRVNTEQLADSARLSGHVFSHTYFSAEDVMSEINRYGHAMVSASKSIFVVGGASRCNALRFDLHSDHITNLPRMNIYRHGLAAVIFKREIYVIGGKRVDKNSSISNVEKFDALSNKWTEISSLNVARYRPGACVINDQIVVVGGGSGKIEVYDDDEDEWNIIGEYEDLKDVFSIFPC